MHDENRVEITFREVLTNFHHQPLLLLLGYGLLLCHQTFPCNKIQTDQTSQ